MELALFLSSLAFLLLKLPVRSEVVGLSFALGGLVPEEVDLSPVDLEGTVVESP